MFPHGFEFSLSSEGRKEASGWLRRHPLIIRFFHASGYFQLLG
jgi:hypothetical protein